MEIYVPQSSWCGANPYKPGINQAPPWLEPSEICHAQKLIAVLGCAMGITITITCVENVMGDELGASQPRSHKHCQKKTAIDQSHHGVLS